jgi:hypothetical protein
MPPFPPDAALSVGHAVMSPYAALSTLPQPIFGHASMFLNSQILLNERGEIRGSFSTQYIKNLSISNRQRFKNLATENNTLLYPEFGNSPSISSRVARFPIFCSTPPAPRFTLKTVLSNPRVYKMIHSAIHRDRSLTRDHSHPMTHFATTHEESRVEFVSRFSSRDAIAKTNLSGVPDLLPKW